MAGGSLKVSFPLSMAGGQVAFLEGGFLVIHEEVSSDGEACGGKLQVAVSLREEGPRNKVALGCTCQIPIFTQQLLPSLRNTLCGKGYLRGVVSETSKERANLGADQP